MPEETSNLWGRLFGRRSKKQPTLPAPCESAAASQFTVGLCFNYERGVGFVNEYLTDVGMDCILKVLHHNNLRATFFCPARLCEISPESVRKLSDLGHEIAVMGHSGESPRELTDDALKQLILACRNAFIKIGLQPQGFRCPHSQWDGRLAAELARQHFRYSAEHEHAKHPYALVPGPPMLYRVPISTDDRGLLRSEKTVNKTLSKHHRRLREAAEDRLFLSICFHPWILAEMKERMHHWEEWLRTAAKLGARLCRFADVLPREVPIAPKDADE